MDSVIALESLED